MARPARYNPADLLSLDFDIARFDRSIDVTEDRHRPITHLRDIFSVYLATTTIVVGVGPKAVLRLSPDHFGWEDDPGPQAMDPGVLGEVFNDATGLMFEIKLSRAAFVEICQAVSQGHVRKVNLKCGGIPQPGQSDAVRMASFS
jgi:hypothetical protein